MSKHLCLVSLSLIAFGCGNDPGRMSPPDLASTQADLSMGDPPDMIAAKPDLSVNPNADLSGGTPDLAGATPDLAGGGSDMAPVVGNLILQGNLDLWGITSDGYVVYENLATNPRTYNVIPIGGGASTQLAANSATSQVAVYGKVVFVWEAVSGTTGLGTLAVWTAAGGKKGAVTASRAGVGAALDDGSKILYVGNEVGVNGDLVIDDPATMTAPVKILNGAAASFSNDACFPLFGFAGTTRVISTWCAAGTSSPVTVSSFDFTGAKTDLQSSARLFWRLDAAGSKAFVVSSTGAASVVPIAGGAATAIESNVGFGWMSKNGSQVVYRTAETTASLRSLRRSATTAPAPAQLVGMNVAALDEISPDDGYLTYYDGTNIQLASTTVAGTPLLLYDTAVGGSGGSLGDTYTSNSAYVMYMSAFDAVSGITGTLQTRPVGGGAATQRSTTALNVFAAGGSKVLFTDNYDGSGATDIVDVKSVDASGAAAASVIATRTDYFVLLTHAKDKVVYTSHTATPNGLYVSTIP
jgi:hypothetical protein